MSTYDEQQEYQIPKGPEYRNPASPENLDENFMVRAAAMALESNLNIEEDSPTRSDERSSTIRGRQLSNAPPGNPKTPSKITKETRLSITPPASSTIRQYLTVFAHRTSSSKAISAPGGLTYIVEAVDFKEKRFLKLANALTYAYHYGYSCREYLAEDAYHQRHRRHYGGVEESHLFMILSRELTRGGVSDNSSVASGTLSVNPGPNPNFAPPRLSG
uniref:Uncharacterized protein n=1 Tax=Corethron hystrix TaxID=216773 RepID=A0A7S1FQE8_9STRA